MLLSWLVYTNLFQSLVQEFIGFDSSAQGSSPTFSFRESVCICVCVHAYAYAWWDDGCVLAGWYDWSFGELLK